MSGESVSPQQPAAEEPKGWRGEIKVALILLGLGTGYQVVGWGLESWVRDVIKKDPQIQELIALSKENRDKARQMELLMVQIENNQKTHGEFLLRLLGEPRPTGSTNAGS